MLGTCLVGGDKGQVDLGCRRRGKLDLGFLSGFFEPLQRYRVLAQVDALGLFEFAGEPVDDHLVEVIAAQVGVAIGRFDLEDAVA